MTLRILVAVALADVQDVIALRLPENSTVADALEAARLAERFPGRDFSRAAVGIWSRPCGREAKLRDGDRVELYRPLTADPKEKRRSRAKLKPSTRPRNAP